MSLVAYASSEEDSEAEGAAGEAEEEEEEGEDEEEEEEEEEEALPRPPAPQPQPRGLFAALPPPKTPQPPPGGFPPPPPPLAGPPAALRAFGTPPAGRGPASASAASDGGPEERPRPGGLLLPPPRNAAGAAPALGLGPAASAALPGAGGDLSLPRAKKRTEPVKIVVPELHQGDSDSEEDEPARKKTPLQGRGEGSGLSALLPQPKNLTVKETNRLLLPYAFSRKAADNASEAKPAKAPTSSSKPKPPSKPAVATTPSPSAIKAAAKSAALQERARPCGRRDVHVLRHGGGGGPAARDGARASVPRRCCQRPSGIQDGRGFQRRSAQLAAQGWRRVRRPALRPVPCLRRRRRDGCLLPGLLQQWLLPGGGTSPGRAAGDEHRLLLPRRRSVQTPARQAESGERRDQLCGYQG
ncbi:proline-rich protein PRCC isoform X2 [Cygnus atratus]|uniref:proline-rich protein PRCC isoform X2 n=1 Tax=Cygnus atratus TaxID=8868 RepID=UPI0021B74B19|nr:proline-rich protein PRCC isoform X2 [Cygnus atratus]